MSDAHGGSYHPGVVDVETASEIPSGTADRFTSVEVRRDLMAVMSDGIRLCADVYLPEGAGKVPVPSVPSRLRPGGRPVAGFRGSGSSSGR